MTHADGPHLNAYIDALGAIPDTGSVWLCDASGATEPLVKKGVGAKLAGVYRSPRELFAAHQPALALVTMEAGLAPPVIDAALDAGCHVMAEKPACVRVSDFEPLAAKAKAKGQHLMLALANRIDPTMMEARRIVQSGAIGKLYGVELHLIADQTRLTRPAYHKQWFAQKARAGGGYLIWLGIHWLDLAMYITQSRISQVAAFTANVGGQPIDTEDAAAVSFQLGNGALGNLMSGYYLDRSKQSFLKFWGSEGWLEVDVDRKDNPLEWYTNKDKELRRFRPPAGSETGYTAWVRHVVKAANGGTQPILTADESLYVLKTVFAAYRAAESGRTQTV